METVLLIFAIVVLLSCMPSLRKTLREHRYNQELLRRAAPLQRGFAIPQEYRGQKLDEYFTKLCELPEFEDQKQHARKLLLLYHENFKHQFTSEVNRVLSRTEKPLEQLTALLEEYLTESKPLPCASLIAALNNTGIELIHAGGIQRTLREVALKGQWRAEYEIPAILALLLLEQYELLDDQEHTILAKHLASEVMRPTTLTLWLELPQQATA